MTHPTPAGQPKPEWEKHFLHERDYRDLCVRLGFCTPPKHPDPEYGVLCKAGPCLIWRGKLFWDEWGKLNHSAIDFEHCSCQKRL